MTKQQRAKGRRDQCCAAGAFIARLSPFHQSLFFILCFVCQPWSGCYIGDTRRYDFLFHPLHSYDGGRGSSCAPAMWYFCIGGWLVWQKNERVKRMTCVSPSHQEAAGSGSSSVTISYEYDGMACWRPVEHLLWCRYPCHSLYPCHCQHQEPE